MIKNINKFQVDSNVRQSTLPHYKTAQAQSKKRVDIQQKLFPAGLLLFLGLWIGLCFSHNGYMLDQALTCSFIITLILLFRTAEQNGDWAKDH